MEKVYREILFTSSFYVEDDIHKKAHTQNITATSY